MTPAADRQGRPRGWPSPALPSTAVTPTHAHGQRPRWRSALLLVCLLLAPAQASAPAPPQAPVTPGGPLELRWQAPEPEWRAGRVTRPTLHRSRALPVSAAQRAHVRATGDLTSLRPTLQRLYADIESRRPLDVRFVRAGQTWVARATTGWTVNRVQTEQNLLRALQRGARHSTVIVSLTAPRRNVRWAAQQNLQHLATGASSFTGSPAFRVHNIRVGAGRLHGRWIAPNGAFDFNALLGPIRAATGFQPGYVVTGGTLRLEDGGGVCQVSTTVLRAAYRAGLPLLERHAHSYQVGYYGTPGLDAAVYAPAKNLRWRNDTRGPLLLQAEWNVRTAQLRIHLFGTPDGRKVQVGDPRITDITPSPAPTFLLDARMAPGTARRVDMPAPGARVTVERHVTFPDGRTRRDTLTSLYRPWGGVFAVPAGDARLN